MTAHLSWYVARSAGIVGWAVLAASVLWGLALSTRVLGPKPRAVWMTDLHRFLGGLATIFTAIHVGALLFDRYVGFGLGDVLVPLRSSHRPLAVAWGVVALYLLVAVEVTSLVRTRLPRKLWRWVHTSSFGLFVLSTVHGLSAGSDTGRPLTLVMLCVSVAVFALTVARIDQSRARHRPRPTADRPVRTGDVRSAPLQRS